MTAFIFFLIILIFLQGAVRVVLLCLPAILLLSQRVDDVRKTYACAFVCGLLVDLITGRLLGMTAVFLLIATIGTMLVNKRFQKDWKVVVLSSLIFEIVYFLITILVNF